MFWDVAACFVDELVANGILAILFGAHRRVLTPIRSLSGS